MLLIDDNKPEFPEYGALFQKDMGAVSRLRAMGPVYPGFRFTPSGLHYWNDLNDWNLRALESQRAAAFARVRAADEGS